MKKKNRHIFNPDRLKKIAAVLVGIVGLFYLDSGLNLWLAKSISPQAADSGIEISFTDPVQAAMVEVSLPVPQPPKPKKLSFEEYCRRNPISTCWDNRQPTDFLYQEETSTAVLKSEEFNHELLDEPADIEATYEEPLPEDIIEANDVYTSKIYSLHIIPEHKPPFFEKPLIAVVIDDMGISLSRTKAISSLQAPLTASFLTYGRQLEQQIENSRLNGQEIMIHVPMEPQTNIDVAPDVLTTKMSDDEIKQNLLTMISKFHDVQGINNHMGSKLTEDRERMDAVMDVLHEKQLFFLDSKTSAKSQAHNAAKDKHVAYTHRHVFIDNNNDKAYILGQLQKAENIALKNGYAIAIGHPKSETFAALKEWLPTLESKQVELVPLSKIVKILNPGFIGPEQKK